jgi:hypothetical protein
VITPRARAAGSSRDTACSAPRALKAPTCWRFSALSHSSQPAIASSACERITGVTRVSDPSRPAAARTSAADIPAAIPALSAAASSCTGASLNHTSRPAQPPASPRIRASEPAAYQVQHHARVRSLLQAPTWVLYGLAAAAVLALQVATSGLCGPWDPWETHYGEVARQILVRGDPPRSLVEARPRPRRQPREHLLVQARAPLLAHGPLHGPLRRRRRRGPPTSSSAAPGWSSRSACPASSSAG